MIKLLIIAVSFSQMPTVHAASLFKNPKAWVKQTYKKTERSANKIGANVLDGLTLGEYRREKREQEEKKKRELAAQEARHAKQLKLVQLQNATSQKDMISQNISGIESSIADHQWFLKNLISSIKYTEKLYTTSSFYESNLSGQKELILNQLNNHIEYLDKLRSENKLNEQLHQKLASEITNYAHQIEMLSRITEVDGQSYSDLNYYIYTELEKNIGSLEFELENLKKQEQAIELKLTELK